MVGGILFCLILSWNPYIMRLELPFFLLMAPAVGTLTAAVLDRRWLIGGSALLLVASLPYVLDNETRSVIAVVHAEQTDIPKPWDAIFRDRPGLYAAYHNAVAVIRGRAAGGVGLVLGAIDSWEYPLWLMLNENDARARVRIEHICLQEGDKPIPAFNPQVVLLVDRPAPQLLSCAQGQFEREADFPTMDPQSANVYVYRRVSERN
jgi:hypothetical protein